MSINWPVEAHEYGCWPEAIETDWRWCYARLVWGKQGKHHFCDDPGTAHSAGLQPALPWSHRLPTQRCLEFTVFTIGIIISSKKKKKTNGKKTYTLRKKIYIHFKPMCKSGRSVHQNFKITHGCFGQSPLRLPQSAALHLSLSSLDAEAGHQVLQPLRQKFSEHNSKKWIKLCSHLKKKAQPHLPKWCDASSKWGSRCVCCTLELIICSRHRVAAGPNTDRTEPTADPHSGATGSGVDATQPPGPQQI